MLTLQTIEELEEKVRESKDNNWPVFSIFYPDIENLLSAAKWALEHGYNEESMTQKELEAIEERAWWNNKRNLRVLLSYLRTVEQDVLTQDIIPEIVAEAERRGERRAWEGAALLVEGVANEVYQLPEVYIEILKRIAAKLNALK